MQTPLLSYLLRIWPSSDDPSRYRLLVENSMTGERRGFSDIDEFSHYLVDEIQSNNNVAKNKCTEKELPSNSEP